MITTIETRNVWQSLSRDIVLFVSPQGQTDTLERTLVETLELDYKQWGTLPDLSGSQRWEVKSFEINSRFPRHLYTITGILHPNLMPNKADIPENLIDLGNGEHLDFGQDDVFNNVRLSRSLMRVELPKLLDTLPSRYLSLIIGFSLEGLSMPYEKLYLPTSRIQCEAAAHSKKHVTLVEHVPSFRSMASLSKLFSLFAWSLPPSCRSVFG